MLVLGLFQFLQKLINLPGHQESRGSRGDRSAGEKYSSVQAESCDGRNHPDQFGVSGRAMIKYEFLLRIM